MHVLRDWKNIFLSGSGIYTLLGKCIQTSPPWGSEIPTVILLFMAGEINEIGYKMFRDLGEEACYQLFGISLLT